MDNNLLLNIDFKTIAPSSSSNGQAVGGKDKKNRDKYKKSRQKIIDKKMLR